MSDIRCPKCGEIFQVDESGYQKIVQQVRDTLFCEELAKREKELSEKQDSALELELSKRENEKIQALSEKDSLIQEREKEIERLKAELGSQEAEAKVSVAEVSKNMQKDIAEKEATITRLQEELKAKDREHQLKLEVELKELNAKLDASESQTKLDVAKVKEDMQKDIAGKDAIITKLQEELKAKEMEHQLKLDMELKELNAKLAESESQKQLELANLRNTTRDELEIQNLEIFRLKSEIDNKESAFKIKENALKESYNEQLKQKNELIEYYKDFKARQSTKMIGESLEQHCLNEFNKLRMTAFPNAYFDKDNDARTGSKGDFIYREFSEDGTEFISIMFEMKNEADFTATKHKNEDFFKELDKDRTEKGCEYAILVSMLEKDNDYYNNGIVDVSYRYPKMYVIRPQFFIPMITLLRGAAINSLKYMQELIEVKNQQTDIRHFEENMNAFKSSFSRNYELANKKFSVAIAEIDKTIEHLEKTKEALLASGKQLRIANDKVDDLSIKKLTKNAPSVRKMFDELHNGVQMRIVDKTDEFDEE